MEVEAKYRGSATTGLAAIAKVSVTPSASSRPGDWRRVPLAAARIPQGMPTVYRGASINRHGLTSETAPARHWTVWA